MKCSPLICFLIATSRPISIQENKRGIGPDRNKIEHAHGLSVPTFCSSLNLSSNDEELKYFQLFGPAVWIIQDGNRSDAHFPEWKAGSGRRVDNACIFLSREFNG